MVKKMGSIGKGLEIAVRRRGVGEWVGGGLDVWRVFGAWEAEGDVQPQIFKGEFGALLLR